MAKPPRNWLEENAGVPMSRRNYNSVYEHSFIVSESPQTRYRLQSGANYFYTALKILPLKDEPLISKLGMNFTAPLFLNRLSH
jgi:hypothetical protein